MNVFRVGEYKSAVETFTRTDMSPEDREESHAYLNALWTHLPGRGRRARASSPRTRWRSTSTRFMHDRAGAPSGDAGQGGPGRGLVTGLKSSLEVEQRMIELVGEDDERRVLPPGLGR